MVEQSPLGLIAGEGRFPLELAQAIRNRGNRIVAVGLKGLSATTLEVFVDETHWLHLGELSSLLEIFRQAGSNCVVMAGKVPKTLLYGDPSRHHFDARALSLLAELKDRKDDSILSLLANFLEREGLHVCSQVEFVSDLLAPEGALGDVSVTPSQLRDIAFGWPIAKAIGALDIGQTLVVGNLAVLAVEAIEGTDAAIRRGGSLGKGCACAVKIAKPNQDFRFDVPAIGPETIEVLSDSGVFALAVEAGKTLVLGREETLRRANEAGIAIVGVTPKFLGLVNEERSS